jgi:transposase InsO family protein
MAIEELRTAPRSPWQNAYAERLVGSIRRECLDHVIVVNETGLVRVLSRYLAHYHHSRTHLSLVASVAVTYCQVPKNEPFRSGPSCANSLDEVSIGSDT